MLEKSQMRWNVVRGTNWKCIEDHFSFQFSMDIKVTLKMADLNFYKHFGIFFTEIRLIGMKFVYIIHYLNVEIDIKSFLTSNLCWYRHKWEIKSKRYEMTLSTILVLTL